MEEIFQFTGAERTKVIIGDDYLIIERKGLRNWFETGGMGFDKKISLDKVNAVQLKEPRFTVGHLQFFIIDGNERSKGYGPIKENTIFFDKKELDMANKIKSLVDTYIKTKNQKQIPTSNLDLLEELKKLKELQEIGAITDKEYDQLKAKFIKQL